MHFCEHVVFASSVVRIQMWTSALNITTLVMKTPTVSIASEATAVSAITVTMEMEIHARVRLIPVLLNAEALCENHSNVV